VKRRLSERLNLPINPEYGLTYTAPDFEARSLHIHEIVVEMITRDPAEIDRAKGILLRWIGDGQNGDGTSTSQPYLAAWLKVIEGGLEACVTQMLDPSEWGDVMRSCSPFGCLISPAQRRKAFAKFKVVQR